MKRNLVLFIASLLFLSCSMDENYLSPELSTTDHEIMQTVVAQLGDYGIASPCKIAKHGDILAVGLRHEGNNVNLLQLSNGSSQEWLPLGDGENEAWGVDNLSINTRGEISTFDFSTGKIHRNNPLSRGTTSPLVLDENRTHLSAVQGDHFVISTGLYEQGKYRLYSPDNDSEAYFISYPEHPDYPELSEYTKSILWASTVLRLRPDNKAFVCTDIRSGQIDICSIEGNSISLVCRHSYYYPHVKVLDGKNPQVAYYSDNVTGFRDVAVSNEYIYVLYSGKTYKKEGQKINRCATLLVFDWNGTLLRNCSIPDMATYITYDTEENQLYGVTPDAKLVQYNL